MFATLAIVLSVGPAAAADVDVRLEPVAEGGGIVRVDVRADIQSDLRTFGVTVSYDPAVLRIVEASKNEATWSLSTHAYGDPDLGVAGEVVMWGAYFDRLSPTSGVSGASRLLGDARFEILSAGDPGMAVTFAEGPPFDNFVTTSGSVLDGAPDGVSFVPEPVSGHGLAAGLLGLAGLRRHRAARRAKG